MKEIPILFSTAMVQANLRRQKTVTRRIVKPKDVEKINVFVKDIEFGFTVFTPPGHISVRGILADGRAGESFIRSPYGRRGDKLWVRETWGKVHHSSYRQSNGVLQMPFDENYVAVFKAGWERSAPRWKPSIHMPKIAARLWLKVGQITIERLQQITEEESAAEGVDKMIFITGEDFGWRNYGNPKKEVPFLNKRTARLSYESLWKSINGDGSWDENPWVWVVRYEVDKII